MDKLEEILVARRGRVAQAKEKRSIQELESLTKSAKPRASFLKAIDQKGRISLIAEMKRRSPSAGLIREPFDPIALAKAYEQGGAAAVSVLTESDWFQGRDTDMEQVATATKLPILRKDFIFDPYQIVEAKVIGASAVLLIADMVSKDTLLELAACATQFELDALVEVFTEEALPRAMATGSPIIGINTRNLRTLEMDPQRIQKLMPAIPAEKIVVAESGIKTAAEVQAYKSMRVSAILVGESLLKQQDMEKAVRDLMRS